MKNLNIQNIKTNQSGFTNYVWLAQYMLKGKTPKCSTDRFITDFLTAKLEETK
jgi:hypothetical protein